MGLGDAAIVELNYRRTPFVRSASATVAAVAVFSAVGAVALVGVARLVFQDDWNSVSPAVMVFAATLPLTTGAAVLSQLLLASERVFLTTGIALLTAVAATAGLVFFVVALGLSVLGGALASLLGSLVGLGFLIGLWGPQRRALLPRWDRTYLSRALRFGVVVQIAALLFTLAGRLDLLVVYAIRGRSDAGQYSVALTLGVLVAYGAMAITYAAFPRLASLTDSDASVLTARVFRVGVAGATLTALVLVAVIPVAVVLLFGSAYRPAIVPSWLLLPGGIFFSGQFVLARASAARGNPGLLIRSFGVSLVVMLTLDIVTVPGWGTTAAAMAASVGPLAGLIVCLAAYVRLFGSRTAAAKLLVPNRKDVMALVSFARSLCRGAREWRRYRVHSVDRPGRDSKIK
jgi:O-antigen/teichoic acid export membrane protein